MNEQELLNELRKEAEEAAYNERMEYMERMAEERKIINQLYNEQL